MTAAATVVAVGFDTKVTIPNLSLVFVVLMIVAGDNLGLDPSLCSAILGAFTFNFFLRNSLAVDDPANVWAIGERRTSGPHNFHSSAKKGLFQHNRPVADTSSAPRDFRF
ncbi:DUF4118 domain-containing protein [Bradyrhizobium sp. McL0615]|uniref:DUF4118 domain-containing protein n=1 Tax=Bradyrhizobium sp. McL0615 TaxID=3415673 RepID=UPI003CFACE06